MLNKKILFFDLETAPMVTFSWRMYDELTSTEMIKDDWFILCWACKWLGEDKVYTNKLPDYKGYKYNPKNDKALLQDLRKFVDTADVIVAHNGRKFDVRKMNSRLLYNHIPPPSPYKIVDTLEVAKNNFAFTSKKLGELGKFLKVGQKESTGGFELWKKCLNGNLEAWAKMEKYCAQDVVLLEKVYLKMLPYIMNHPNLNLYANEGEQVCPKCGSKNIERRGFTYTGQGKYQRCFCKGCFGWSRFKENLLSKGQIQVVN